MLHIIEKLDIQLYCHFHKDRILGCAMWVHRRSMISASQQSGTGTEKFYCWQMSLIVLMKWAVANLNYSNSCTIMGNAHLSDFRYILPFLKKYGINPVNGKKLSAKEMVKLNFHKNSKGRSSSFILHEIY